MDNIIVHNVLFSIVNFYMYTYTKYETKWNELMKYFIQYTYEFMSIQFHISICISIFYYYLLND